MFGLGAVLGGLMSGLLGSRYGPKTSLTILAVMDILHWTLMMMATNLSMMLVSRFLAGFVAAGYSPNIQIFVGEISYPHLRGVLLGLTIPIMAIGVLTVYALGALCLWFVVAGVCCSAPLTLFFTSL